MPRNDQVLLLRDIPTSDRFFWKDTHEEHVQLWNKGASEHIVADRTADGTQNMFLAANAVTTMALNEFVVHQANSKATEEAERHGGYFVFFPSQDQLKKVGGKNDARTIEAAGHDFPAIMFMDYNWCAESSASFQGSSHRVRYLACHGLCNPPALDTPVYTFQYSSNGHQRIFRTDSFIILETLTAHYVLLGSELSKILGEPGKDGWYKGQRAIWSSATTDKNALLLQKLDEYRVEGIEDLYYKIRERCQEPEPAPLSFREVWTTVPRPRNPEPGCPLGLIPNMDASKAGPTSRRFRPRLGQVEKDAAWTDEAGEGESNNSDSTLEEQSAYT